MENDKARILNHLQNHSDKPRSIGYGTLYLLNPTEKCRCPTLQRVFYEEFYCKNISEAILRYRNNIMTETLEIAGKPIDILDIILTDIYKKHPLGTNTDILIEALLVSLTNTPGKFKLTRL